MSEGSENLSAGRSPETSPADVAYGPTEGHEMHILVLAPTSNDANLTAGFLKKAGLQTIICADIPDLCARLEAGCGAILLAEEALATKSVELLLAQLALQPSWSDLPIVIVTGGGEARLRRQLLEAFGTAGNISIVERPVRPGTLVSTFEFALRSRRRQYQVRSLLQERDKLVANVQQQARIFDTTLSAIADFAYIFDSAGRFLHINKALLDLWGLSLSEAVGKTFFELPYPADLAAKLHQQVLHVFATGDVLKDETSYTSPMGFTAFYEYIFSPVVGNDGRIEVVAGSTRDITERKRDEEFLRTADRRKDEFLAMLAHELRNPLASVASAATLLRGLSSPAEQEWAASVIDRQTRQLTHLIDDLLDVSRITMGKIRLRTELIDAATILDRACESARPLITERRHDFVLQYVRGSLWLRADPTRVEQIVLNLLTNAAKYTPEGGRIELTACQQGREVCIVVRDNGMGIAPHRLPEMFHLFTQGERSIDRSEGGLGIGLTIVQKLAELHGGRIHAHSDGPNLGSAFTVYFPTAKPPIAEQSPVIGATPDPERQALRVLVVDDNADTAEGLARLLKRAGHHVSLAFDGVQALQHARAWGPHAIVLDIGLPGMDGYEVVQRMRSEAGCVDSLIIAVTGYGQDEDRLRTRQAGFNHHLVKPVDLDELKRILGEVR